MVLYAPRIDAPSASLEESHANRGSDLAVGRRERPPLRRSKDDDKGRAKLDAEAPGWSDRGELDAEGLHDFVPISGEADADSDASESQDPYHVVANLRVGRDVTILPRDVDCKQAKNEEGEVSSQGGKWGAQPPLFRTRSIGAHCVRNIVGSMRKRIHNCSKHLHVSESPHEAERVRHKQIRK